MVLHLHGLIYRAEAPVAVFLEVLPLIYEGKSFKYVPIAYSACQTVKQTRC